ncbi:MAG: ABC transporter permease subunit [Candidimonas sp.]|jgi:His/Glu/Gln/Arg/opine family amino acid ABC transporter permease subunit
MDFQLIWESLPLLWQGTLITLQLSVVTIVVSTLVSIPLSILRTDKRWYIYGPLEIFSQVFRGTPLMVQLFIVYYGLAQIDFLRQSWAWVYLRQAYWCALITFTLNTSAYLIHIFRGAIQAVPEGEIEAAHAFGLGAWARYRYVILPKAFLLALPSYGNELIKTVKRTSLASVITIADLTGVANMLVSRTFAPYEIFLTAAAIYLVFAWAANRAVHYMEHRLSHHMRPVTASSAAIEP